LIEFDRKDGPKVSARFKDGMGLHERDSDEMLPRWLWELGCETWEKEGDAVR
jgi:hypothetical protein